MKNIQHKSTGDGGSYGVTTGLMMGQFFVKLMEAQRKEKLDDDQLADALRKEFPHGSTKYLRYIRLYRSYYNNGKWASQCGTKPDFVVHKYLNKKPLTNLPGPKTLRSLDADN